MVYSMYMLWASLCRDGRGCVPKCGWSVSADLTTSGQAHKWATKYPHTHTHFVVFVPNKNTANAIKRDKNNNKTNWANFLPLFDSMEGREKEEWRRGQEVAGYAKQMGSFAGTREANKRRAASASASSESFNKEICANKINENSVEI